MVQKFKFCLWLVDLLTVKPLTLIDIQHKWVNSTLNDRQEELPERTFSRYRRDIESLLNVDIQCDKRNGNIYFIANKEELQSNRLLEWLRMCYRLTNLSKDIKKKTVVVLDPAPPAAEHLEPILDAIERHQSMQLVYKSHYKDPQDISFFPVFVRLCHQRWYVIGLQLETMKERVLAFERISSMNNGDPRPDLKQIALKRINPADYFIHNYGVLKEHKSEFIKIRVTWPQNAYIKDVPLHHSQRVIQETEDYSDFELFISPTFDFIQSLLTHRETLTVLSPQTFKEEMIDVLKNMLANYQ
ncbi:MAG TPA: WYL domain-containing protein [Sphingobacterium sp.]|nr:putative transcriptional regulator [Sphingobacterium faecium PCAi_F2.5]HCU45835.1 WYL domain-containing protein [Sphingobacterium sp.]